MLIISNIIFLRLKSDAKACTSPRPWGCNRISRIFGLHNVLNDSGEIMDESSLWSGFIYKFALLTAENQESAPG